MDYPLFVFPRFIMGIVIFNVVCFISGVVIVSAGFVLEDRRFMIYDLYAKSFPLSLLIFVMCSITVFVLTIDLTYYRSSLTVNSCQILSFCMVVTLICSMELSAFFSATLMRHVVLQTSQRYLASDIMRYPQSELIQTDTVASTSTQLLWIDQIQSEFECCGVNKWTDWGHQFKQRPENLSETEPFHVPMSCCLPSAPPTCGTNITSQNTSTVFIYTTGCMYVVNKFLDEEIFYFGMACISLFTLQVVGLLLMCFLHKRKHYRTIRSS